MTDNDDPRGLEALQLLTDAQCRKVLEMICQLEVGGTFLIDDLALYCSMSVIGELSDDDFADCVEGWLFDTAEIFTGAVRTD